MLLDSYAWIELFQGSEGGKKVKHILSTTECFTSIISISEVVEWCLRNNRDYSERIKRITKLSQIINLNEDIAVLAGKINFNNKKLIKDWGMIDSLIYATARIYGLIVLTGDEHFKNLAGVEMLN